METRRIGKLPPYVYLVVIRVKSKNEEKANEASFQIKENLEGRRFENVMAVGPATPYIAIQGGYYIKTILVKYRKRDELFPYLIELQKKLSGRAGIEIEFDVDPLDY
jgi:primosomal protein N'